MEFRKVAASVFAIVALFHLSLAITGTNITLGATMLPVWVSWIAAVITGALSYWGFTN